MLSFLSFKKIQSNWKSGLTVALISIPLSLSLAIASGATPLQGILTAIWSGLIYSFFAGSRYNVVGPAGALTGLLAIFAFSYGAAAFPTLSILTGLLILMAYFFKLERYLVFVPASVLHGFTLGVALTIGLNQLNFALGLTGLVKHEALTDNLMESLNHVSEFSLITLIIFLVFLGGLFLFAKLMPRMPGAVILAPIGIVIGMLTTNGTLPFSVHTLQSTYGNLHMSLFEFSKPVFSVGILFASMTIAFVAILETLISAKIADGMAQSKEKYGRRKEMKALAFANIASGLAGGLPATGVFARTALNVKSGATDKTACFLQSVFVAIISMFLLGYFTYIPLAVIAAILVFASIRMVEVHHYRRAFDYDHFSFGVIILVAFITIYHDPMLGILAGTAITLMLFVERLSRGQFELVFNSQENNIIGSVNGDGSASESKKSIYEDCHTMVYSLKGQLAYLNALAHTERFEKKLTDYENVILRFRELSFIDLDGADAFDEIVETVERKGKKVYVSGVSSLVGMTLDKSKHYNRLKQDGHVFDKTTTALSYLGYGKLNYYEQPVE